MMLVGVADLVFMSELYISNSYILATVPVFTYLLKHFVLIAVTSLAEIGVVE